MVWDATLRRNQSPGLLRPAPTLRNFLAELRIQHHLMGNLRVLQQDGVRDVEILPASLLLKRALTRRMSPVRASWLLFLPEERLAPQQQDQRDLLRGCHPDVEVAYQLVSAFVLMLAEQREEDRRVGSPKPCRATCRNSKGLSAAYAAMRRQYARPSRLGSVMDTAGEFKRGRANLDRAAMMRTMH